jgi:hypothetical protein
MKEANITPSKFYLSFLTVFSSHSMLQNRGSQIIRVRAEYAFTFPLESQTIPKKWILLIFY